MCYTELATLDLDCNALSSFTFCFSFMCFPCLLSHRSVFRHPLAVLPYWQSRVLLLGVWTQNHGPGTLSGAVVSFISRSRGKHRPGL